jgi:hypothetical protein
MFINRKKKTLAAATSQPHLNWMGGPSYDITNPIMRLRLAASSCFFGEPMYYQEDKTDTRPRRAPRNVRVLSPEEQDDLRATLNALDPREWRDLSPAALMESAIDAALDHNPEAVLQEAVRLRQVEHIRTTPQVILVRAAHHPQVRGTSLIRQYAPGIIQRADEPAVGMAYQMTRYGKPIPNALKRAWKAALERYNDYSLAKYRMESRQVKTVDVVNLVHPRSESVDKLAKGTLHLENETWEAIISAKGSTREAWSEALGVMGHMALLRNLRNLLEHDVPPQSFQEQLLTGAVDGKQLPFRYYSAFRAVEKLAPPSLQDVIEQCMVTALGNLPRFQGRVMSLCDNSGSAQGATTSSMGTMQISTIANLTAVLTAHQADEGYVGVFGDRLETLAIRQRGSIFDQLEKVEHLGRGIGGSTENGIWLFWDQAIRQRQHWDMVFVYSDMQAGHGGLYGTDGKLYKDFIWQGANYIHVPKLIQHYRAAVNPDVRVFLVQVAGYQDTIIPEFYDKTYILGGWSDGVLRFAAAMAGLDATPA